MALKHYKPTSPGQRQLVLIDRADLYKGKPVKTLVEAMHSTGGRNNTGRTTAYHRGGGHKRAYRKIDFKRRAFDMAATVERLEYDPNRSAFIALVRYENGEQSYILAPQRLNVGDTVISGEKVDVKPGNAMPLKNIPIGTIVHNVEMKPGKGGQIGRSAGSYVQLVGKDSGYAQLKLRSGELRMVQSSCMATIGAVSNPDHQNEVISKAGRNRWKGKRPHVRGAAMNPIDHPHGGGEGKTSGGRHPVSPWGQSAKGLKTRSPKKSNKMVIRSRHKAKGNKR